MAGGMHPRRGRDGPREPVTTSPAYRRLMGFPEPPRPPLSLERQHVVVETEDGPAAGLLVELDEPAGLARVMYALGDEPEAQSLLETWVHTADVRTAYGVVPPSPRSS